MQKVRSQLLIAIQFRAYMQKFRSQLLIALQCRGFYKNYLRIRIGISCRPADAHAGGRHPGVAGDRRARRPQASAACVPDGEASCWLLY